MSGASLCDAKIAASEFNTYTNRRRGVNGSPQVLHSDASLSYLTNVNFVKSGKRDSREVEVRQ